VKCRIALPSDLGSAPAEGRWLPSSQLPINKGKLPVQKYRGAGKN